MCVLSHSLYGSELKQQAFALLDAVKASLPAEWTQDGAPPFRNVIWSAGFTSAIGMSGQIWLDQDAEKPYLLCHRIMS